MRPAADRSDVPGSSAVPFRDGLEEGLAAIAIVDPRHKIIERLTHSGRKGDPGLCSPVAYPPAAVAQQGFESHCVGRLADATERCRREHAHVPSRVSQLQTNALEPTAIVDQPQ